MKEHIFHKHQSLGHFFNSPDFSSRKQRKLTISSQKQVAQFSI